MFLLSVYEDLIVPRLQMIGVMASRDYTYKKMAETLGVPEGYFAKWRKEHPEIEEACRIGKDIAGLQAEEALLKKALGFTTTEVTKTRKQVGVDFDGNPVYKLVVTKKVYKEVAPDLGALQYYLENKLTKYWTRSPQNFEDADEINSALVNVVELLNAPVEGREVDDF